MIIIGLWHEITLPFLLWGAFQARGIYFAFLFKNISNFLGDKEPGQSLCI